MLSWDDISGIGVRLSDGICGLAKEVEIRALLLAWLYPVLPDTVAERSRVPHASELNLAVIQRRSSGRNGIIYVG